MRQCSFATRGHTHYPGILGQFHQFTNGSREPEHTLSEFPVKIMNHVFLSSLCFILMLDSTFAWIRRFLLLLFVRIKRDPPIGYQFGVGSDKTRIHTECLGPQETATSPQSSQKRPTEPVRADDRHTNYSTKSMSSVWHGKSPEKKKNPFSLLNEKGRAGDNSLNNATWALSSVSVEAAHVNLQHNWFRPNPHRTRTRNASK